MLTDKEINKQYLTKKTIKLINNLKIKKQMTDLKFTYYHSEYLFNGFGYAIMCLKKGQRVKRTSWPENTFIFKQIPSIISKEIIPNMQSVPDSVKKYIQTLPDEQQTLNYKHQCVMYNNGVLNNWHPSIEDCFETDWICLI